MLYSLCSRDCRAGKAAYSAFHLEKRFNLTEIDVQLKLQENVRWFCLPRQSKIDIDSCLITIDIHSSLSQSISMLALSRSILIPALPESIAIPALSQSILIPALPESIAIPGLSQSILISALPKSIAIPALSQSIDLLMHPDIFDMDLFGYFLYLYLS